jgi:hypothetical protein
MKPGVKHEFSLNADTLRFMQASFPGSDISNTLVGLGDRLFLVRAATPAKPCHP